MPRFTLVPLLLLAPFFTYLNVKGYSYVYLWFLLFAYAGVFINNHKSRGSGFRISLSLTIVFSFTVLVLIIIYLNKESATFGFLPGSSIEGESARVGYYLRFYTMPFLMLLILYPLYWMREDVEASYKFFVLNYFYVSFLAIFVGWIVLFFSFSPEYDPMRFREGWSPGRPAGITGNATFNVSILSLTIFFMHQSGFLSKHVLLLYVLGVFMQASGSGFILLFVTLSYIFWRWRRLIFMSFCGILITVSLGDYYDTPYTISRLHVSYLTHLLNVFWSIFHDWWGLVKGPSDLLIGFSFLPGFTTDVEYIYLIASSGILFSVLLFWVYLFLAEGLDRRSKSFLFAILLISGAHYGAIFTPHFLILLILSRFSRYSVCKSL